jgi:hypothetical protein
MKLYDVEDAAQQGLADSNQDTLAQPVFDLTDFASETDLPWKV